MITITIYCWTSVQSWVPTIHGSTGSWRSATCVVCGTRSRKPGTQAPARYAAYSLDHSPLTRSLADSFIVISPPWYLVGSTGWWPRYSSVIAHSFTHYDSQPLLLAAPLTDSRISCSHTGSLAHRFSHPLINPFTRSPIHSLLTQPMITSYFVITRSFIYCHSRNSLVGWLIHLPTHSLTRSLTLLGNR